MHTMGSGGVTQPTVRLGDTPVMSAARQNSQTRHTELPLFGAHVAYLSNNSKEGSRHFPGHFAQIFKHLTSYRAVNKDD